MNASVSFGPQPPTNPVHAHPFVPRHRPRSRPTHFRPTAHLPGHAHPFATPTLPGGSVDGGERTRMWGRPDGPTNPVHAPPIRSRGGPRGAREARGGGSRAAGAGWRRATPTNPGCVRTPEGWHGRPARRRARGGQRASCASGATQVRRRRGGQAELGGAEQPHAASVRGAAERGGGGPKRRVWTGPLWRSGRHRPVGGCPDAARLRRAFERADHSVPGDAPGAGRAPVRRRRRCGHIFGAASGGRRARCVGGPTPTNPVAAGRGAEIHSFHAPTRFTPIPFVLRFPLPPSSTPTSPRPTNPFTAHPFVPSFNIHSAHAHPFAPRPPTRFTPTHSSHAHQPGSRPSIRPTPTNPVPAHPLSHATIHAHPFVPRPPTRFTPTYPVHAHPFVPRPPTRFTPTHSHRTPSHTHTLASRSPLPPFPERCHARRFPGAARAPPRPRCDARHVATELDP
ncbi:hypothetical protein C7M84_024538 [Penaeus vannamei]|uniref:Uncharacterized protein n=1 Tax=Penaeus vannamei TaxID=6689 RepID=A0A3R7PTM7_PENVA|nr:hypothetical protein C7M84_024538 [Penaeus vannamei]